MSAQSPSPPLSLNQQLDALGASLPDGIAEKVGAYLALLQKWNRTYNLTAIREPAQMLTHHVLDALAILPALDRVLTPVLANQPTARLLDVGSGGGIPGLMLAMARPGWQVTMVDAVQKKTAFVAQAIAELRLPNAQALTARVESLRVEALVPPMRYDLAVSRAFSDLATFMTGCRHLLTPHGVWAAMKGAVPEAEIAALPADIAVRAVEALTVPGLDARRHLILLERVHG
ncbi:MAG: 16S rRNA (guanine(527)-N(7))-methyltransferase RsmG [Proteobacteria bacterium]|nr:16S rRNA (guanine(527)-N(7))-methyltransferase RsmG [Pseudomonadota bacterium]MCL2306875.1 16S rRNA (guanine(527)-N(7))-methyltransferase RsmG [Pseudomonadota bacterium]